MASACGLVQSWSREAISLSFLVVKLGRRGNSASGIPPCLRHPRPRGALETPEDALAIPGHLDGRPGGYFRDTGTSRQGVGRIPQGNGVSPDTPRAGTG